MSDEAILRAIIDDTVSYRKTDGRWQVTHEHVSVAFDIGTMQPSFADNDYSPA